MRLTKFFFLWVVFLLCNVFNVKAQKLILNTTNINSVNGLSQNSIQAIIKDHYGFMWFGTQDGLNKYDGFKFTIYKHSNTNPNTLPANLINALCEDADGNLWVGTRLGGLSKYNRATDAFVTFKQDEADKNSISNNDINVIYNDAGGNLWIGTANGLNLYDKKKGGFKKFYTNAADNHSLSNPKITSILEDSDHNLWIGTSAGLNLLNRQTGNITRYLDSKGGKNGNNNTINAIVEDDLKNIWVGTGRGINLIDKKNQEFSYYAIDPDKNLAGAINSIFCLKKTGGNKFWIGSNTTLQLFDASKKKLIPIDEHTNGESLMPNDGIYSLWEDNAGILWIGTTSEGVIKYDRNLTIFPAYKASLTYTPSAKNVIRSITEDKKGNLYLATDVGVEYFNRTSGTYQSYLHDLKNKKSLISNYTLTVMACKKADDVWIGTYANGLDKFDTHTGTFRHFEVGKGPKNIRGKGIYALFEDSKGNVWFAAEEGGAQLYNPATDSFIRYTHDDKKLNSICDNTLQAFCEDKKGNIWMGGYSNGISVFNPSTHTFTHINSSNSGLTNNVISAFYEDSRGNMWIGTMEGGLNCYEEKTHKIISFTEKNGVINNTINFITGDSGGHIWISTIQGITRLDPTRRSFINYGYQNGLKSLEFNLGTGVKLHTGEIAMGNINGFNIVNPDKLLFDKNPPNVVFTGFEIFNKPVVPGIKDSPLKQSILTAKQISLQHSQSMFSIEYAALDFSIPERNKYAYKLEGFDSEWRYVENQRKATYTNLDPDTYTFKVKAANKDGVWNTKQVSIQIVIVPPYWMTWWFRLACGLVIIACTYSFYRYRFTFIKKQQAELKRQVHIRTQEISKQAESLQVLNLELKLQKEELQTQSTAVVTQSEKLQLLNRQLLVQKSQEQKARLIAEQAMDEAYKATLAKSTFLATMSHEIRTPMNGVLGMASLLAETKQNTEQREYTDAIIKSGESLLLVINDILDFSKIESGKLELDNQPFNLRSCIEDVMALFNFKAAESAIKLSYQIDHQIPANIIADSLRLRQVLTNLIGNAIKFTHKGWVCVLVTNRQREDKFELHFEVQDTGIGIAEPQIAKLFKAFNQVDSSITRKYGGSGLGLAICKRLIELMGGDIGVKSEVDTGSTFSFWINYSVDNSTPKALNAGENGNDIVKAEIKKPILSNQFAIEFPLNILVAEDNLMNQKLLLRILNKLGYQPSLANDGQEVLNMLAAGSYDLILMDIQMPHIDGLEATRIIRRTYGSRPLIAAMTANALSEDKENCINAGMDRYMSKPISIELLMKNLSDLFTLHAGNTSLNG